MQMLGPRPGSSGGLGICICAFAVYPRQVVQGLGSEKWLDVMPGRGVDLGERGGQSSPTRVLTDTERPDLTISEVVRLLLAPEIPAQWERCPAIA